MTKEISTKNIILYADDDYDDVELVTEIFTKHVQNVELVAVSDGLEALSFLKDLDPADPNPCLIILDINMPRMDGKETLSRIRDFNRFKQVPIIIFTTSSQQEDKEFAKKYNAGFLAKPINYNQLDIIAEKFIEHCSEEIKINIKTHKK